MSEQKIGRREAARRTLTVLGVAALAPSALIGCGEDEAALDCTSTAGLTPAQVTTREAQNYVDHSPNPQETCAGCRFYTAGAANACGGCQVLAGPIHPEGYCDLFAAA